MHDNGMITDWSGRSFEAENAINIVKKLSHKVGVVHMAEFGVEFNKHGTQTIVAMPQGANLRQWAGIIANADYFLGCDSVGQHLVPAMDKKGTVVIGSHFVNVLSNDNNLDIPDMGQ